MCYVIINFFDFVISDRNGGVQRTKRRGEICRVILPGPRLHRELAALFARVDQANSRTGDKRLQKVVTVEFHLIFSWLVVWLMLFCNNSVNIKTETGCALKIF